MELSFALPIAGTILLGVGIVMPIRDGRRGRRATIGGDGPVRAEFLFEERHVPSPRADVDDHPESPPSPPSPARDASTKTNECALDDTDRPLLAPGVAGMSRRHQGPVSREERHEIPMREPVAIDDSSPAARPPSAVSVRYAERNDPWAPGIAHSSAFDPARSETCSVPSGVIASASTAASAEATQASLRHDGDVDNINVGVSEHGHERPTTHDATHGDVVVDRQASATSFFAPLQRLFKWPKAASLALRASATSHTSDAPGVAVAVAASHLDVASIERSDDGSFGDLVDTIVLDHEASGRDRNEHDEPVATARRDADAPAGPPESTGDGSLAEKGPTRTLPSATTPDDRGAARSSSQPFVPGIRAVPDTPRAEAPDHTPPSNAAVETDVVEHADAPIVSRLVAHAEASMTTRTRARAVPLTRLPLRPIVARATWTESLDPTLRDAAPERRTRLLREWLDEQSMAVPQAALCIAWREERGEARTMALRLLARQPAVASIDVYRDALKHGTEEERSLAIDACAALGATSEIESALGDRVDAIAARAALAVCPTRRLEDHRTLLLRHLDAGRCDDVLALLAGILQ